MGHLQYLKRIIQTYQSMAMDVHVVVLSEAQKDLGPGVEVVVGLPSKNPWSLPFGHKRIFAENVDRYDLFVYSEDDIEATEDKIMAFLRLASVLKDDEIAGFQLYEVDSGGKVSLPGVHGPFHWKLDSVRRRGDCLVAEFTNEHSACYMVTQAQLKRAIASGGFLREPYAGRFDMLCSAGTDIYTNCGFSKVLCVSAIEDFLLHHLPNRYAGRVGLSLEMFKTQIQTLIDIRNGTHPASILCEAETKFSHRRWSKIYYKEPDQELLDMVPAEAKTVLSVGCGWGALEEHLIKRGARLTGLPIDSVIGGSTVRLGVEMIYRSLGEGLSHLEGRYFECVLVTDILHLQPNPWEVLEQCAQLIAPGGALVIQNHNFNYLPVLFRRALGLGEMRKLRSFAEGGVSAFGVSAVTRRLKALNYQVSATRWFNRPHFNNAPPTNHLGIRKFLGRLMAEDWIIQARREGRNSQTFPLQVTRERADLGS
jgi:2-polyprenyl-3-methyl-5-hydroxy-6-metoxy-1,4-benzoquinol methylase